MSGGTRVAIVPPTLVEGQRLDQPTFHALYQAMPPGTRAELIDGVVYMPSPVSLEHGEAHVLVIVWLDYYADETRGTRVLDNATTILGWKSEPPSLGCCILPDYWLGLMRHWQCIRPWSSVSIVEVSKATRYVDLGPKLRDYERAGVLEYVVRAIDPDEIFWFIQENGVLMQCSIGEDGLYRSAVFPGLWLDPQALLEGNRQRLRAVLDLGYSTPEHTAFVAKLAAAKGNA